MVTLSDSRCALMTAIAVGLFSVDVAEEPDQLCMMPVAQQGQGAATVWNEQDREESAAVIPVQGVGYPLRSSLHCCSQALLMLS
jgi:hypothetical protein